MSHFRFLQAGSFRLDAPPAGLAEFPDALIDLLIDSPYLAAQKVFDAAIEERVDFVTLTGDLADLAHLSPRSVAFLLDHFERLDSHGITVYWAGGRLDPPQDWPPAAEIPGRVHCFPATAPEELSHFRGDRPVANIVGRSWHGTSGFNVGEFRSDSDGLPTIVVAYGQCEPQRLADQVVDYWALGGQPQRLSLGTAQRIIHYAGSPQGRSPDEPGAHGCTLIHVAGDRTMRTQFTACDALRWHTERLTIEDDATLESVRLLLADRVKQLKAEAEPRPVVVTWKIRGGGHLAGPAARRDLAAEWQDWLRKEFFLSGSRPTLWTQAVELDQPDLPAAWFEEESMLGDFLRNLRELAATAAHEVNIAQYVPVQHRTAALATLGQWTPEDHREVLEEAALTGAQLLGAGDREA